MSVQTPPVKTPSIGTLSLRTRPAALAAASAVGLLAALVGCADRPDGPPPLPSEPPSVDTATFEAPREAAPVARASGSKGLQITTLEVHPAKPLSTQDLRVLADASAPSGRMASLRYRWLVNGDPLKDQTGKRLASNLLHKGDRVTVELTVSDGTTELVQQSPQVTILNAPPELITKPQDFKGQLDGFEVKAEDPDGDRLTYRVEDGPLGLTVSTDGVLRYAGTKATKAGSYDTKIFVEDSDGEFVAFPMVLQVSAGQEDKKQLPGQGGDAPGK